MKEIIPSFDSYIKEQVTLPNLQDKNLQAASDLFQYLKKNPGTRTNVALDILAKGRKAVYAYEPHPKNYANIIDFLVNGGHVKIYKLANKTVWYLANQEVPQEILDKAISVRQAEDIKESEEIDESSALTKVLRKLGWFGDTWTPEEYKTQIRKLDDDTLLMWYHSKEKALPNTPFEFQQKLVKLEVERRKLNVDESVINEFMDGAKKGGNWADNLGACAHWISDEYEKELDAEAWGYALDGFQKKYQIKGYPTEDNQKRIIKTLKDKYHFTFSEKVIISDMSR
jgi:hypothetical protein